MFVMTRNAAGRTIGGAVRSQALLGCGNDVGTTGKCCFMRGKGGTHAYACSTGRPPRNKLLVRLNFFLLNRINTFILDYVRCTILDTQTSECRKLPNSLLIIFLKISALGFLSARFFLVEGVVCCSQCIWA